MGRPPMKPEDKRQSITFRLDPEIKKGIQEQAEANGRSVTAEMEARLTALEAFDGKGVELVRAFGQELTIIHRLTRGMTAKPWHRSLKAWAAFKEMFARGPLLETRPDNWTEDEDLLEERDNITVLRLRRLKLVHEIQAMGVLIVEDHRVKQDGKSRGLFAAILGTPSPREITRQSLEILPDSDDKTRVLELLQQVQQLDGEIEAAEESFSSKMQWYANAEKEGRDLYREHLHDVAKRMESEGKPYNFIDRFRLWKDNI